MTLLNYCKIDNDFVDYATENIYNDYSVELPAEYFLISYDVNGNYSNPSDTLAKLFDVIPQKIPKAKNKYPNKGFIKFLIIYIL